MLAVLVKPPNILWVRQEAIRSNGYCCDVLSESVHIICLFVKHKARWIITLSCLVKSWIGWTLEGRLLLALAGV